MSASPNTSPARSPRSISATWCSRWSIAMTCSMAAPNTSRARSKRSTRCAPTCWSKPWSRIFLGRTDSIETIVHEGGPDVFAHNIEVVERLQRSVRDARCDYHRSLFVLEAAKRAGATITKSSVMLGVGETLDEVRVAMRDLRDVGVDIVTFGQYLRPSKKHLEVARFVPPEEFEALGREALAMGFAYAASGPLVRSSYHAARLLCNDV